LEHDCAFSAIEHALFAVERAVFAVASAVVEEEPELAARS
jgi:hypothetical protein